MTRRLRFLFLAVMMAMLPCVTALAQSYDSFYRGENQRGYDFSFNGHYFWQDAQYSPGQVFYNGKYYSGLELNINAHMQQMLVRRSGDVAALVLDRDLLSWAVMRDSTFLNLQYAGIEGAPKGFHVVIADGKDILVKQVRKEIVANTQDTNGKIIGYYDSNYNPKLANAFARIISYAVVKDGVYYPVRNKKDIIKLYPEKKKEIRRVEHNPRFERYAADIMAVVNKGSVPSLTSYVADDSFVKWPEPKENTAYVDNLVAEPLPAGTGNDLPAGWFTLPEDAGGNVVRYVSGKVTVVSLQNKLYEVGDKTKGVKGKVTVSGYVYNSNTDETVPGVVVYDNVTSTYTTTDAKGFYSLKLPVGENVLNFQETMMDDFHAMVAVYDQARVDIMMNEKSEMLQSALISSESREKHRTTKMGLEKMTVKTIRKVPVAFGEGDVLKVVQTLPGVQSVGDASSGINVRGGSVDQNLILFNGNTIYNPSHMFGLFSAFNADLVEGLELYKGSMPVEFGGRIASVLDVKSKSGADKLTGSIGLGLLSSHVSLEGHLGKKTNFVMGGRTTYSDWLLNLLPKNSNYSGGAANFTDANIGIEHKFSAKSSVRADFYYSDDGFSFGADTTFKYSNLNASLLYTQGIKDGTTMELRLGYDQYRNSFSDIDSLNLWEAYKYETGIQQAFVKESFKTKLGDKHILSYGVNGIAYLMGKGALNPASDDSYIIAKDLGQEKAAEFAAWLGDTWQMTDKLSFDYGGRMSAFYAVSSKKFYYHPEARVSAKYSFTPTLSLKGGFGTTSQFVNLISNSASISPMDTWRLASDRILPQTGWQGSTGLYYTAFNGQVDFSVEGYYKRVFNYLDYKSGAVLIMNPDLEDDLVETTGRAYGVEFMAKKSAGKLNGWVSYTYSRSVLREMENRGLASINGGNWYNAPFDKPHSLNVVANYNLTHRFSFSMNIDYSTGRPVTIPVGKYYMGGGYLLAYSLRNAYRIPDYFRMDLAMNIEPGHYLKALTHWSMTFGVYNVTGRKNAYSIFYKSNGLQLAGYKVSVFASQIPYASLNVRF